MQFSMDSLPNPQSMSKYTESIGGDCGNKLPLFHWVPMPPGRFKTLATIWHSKLGVLCDAARQRPNELSVLLDGGLMYSPNPSPTTAEGALNRSLTKTEMAPGTPMEHSAHSEHSMRGVDVTEAMLFPRDRMGLRWVDTAQGESTSQSGKLQTEFYYENGQAVPIGKPFGKPACTANAARVAAGALALLGADCSAIEGAYMEAMTEIASGPCNCYDEEIVLTRMLDKPPWKNLMNPHFGP
jgi:hypothetical protein